MAKFEIVVGSMLGASEYVADALQDILQKHHHGAGIHLDAKLEDLATDAIWLICSSTHGAGELPDNIQPFAEQLGQQDLSGIKFIVIGLGDSSYDTFCYAAQTLERQLLGAGAHLLQPALHIDVLNHPIPEDVAVAWLEALLLSDVFSD